MPHEDQLVAAVLQGVRELHAIHEQLATANNNNAILKMMAEMEKRLTDAIAKASDIAPSIEIAAKLLQVALDKLDAQIPNK